MRSAAAQDFAFSWERVTVYFVVTDRFENGDPSNDRAYGRGLDGTGIPYDFNAAGFFHGGDFAGLTSRIEDGYFDHLGVDVLLITAPYEQIHGWVGGSGGDFQSYAYHGYWPLDFTSVDAALGTETDFARLIDAAHTNGLRIVVDVDLEHAGYATVHDMEEFGFGGLKTDDWRDWRPGARESWLSYSDRFITYADSAQAWSRWWGPSWIRAALPGYEGCGDDDLTRCLHSLPDFKSDSEVQDLPVFLASKWGEDRTEAEIESLNAFFDRTGYARTPANHVVKWLTDWVRRYGIDGFQVDSALPIERKDPARLKTEAVRALKLWKDENPSRALDDLDFWMTGG
ncbi:MAG: alpha-amylase, partial [Bacteroidetes bacterium]|nr:alpha-amylase [Bacteroidota bacterium]